MPLPIPKVVLIPFLLLVLAGCQSDGVVHYTAPEITGRVLAADTHQPLANVRISRTEAQAFEPFGPPKGGQQIIEAAPVLTDADGRFLLESKSVFAPFRSAGWWSAPVTFQHSGYETFSTNYTSSNVVSNTPAGAPVIVTGDVLLEPAAR
jgi:hypothetical protein